MYKLVDKQDGHKQIGQSIATKPDLNRTLFSLDLISFSYFCCFYHYGSDKGLLECFLAGLDETLVCTELKLSAILPRLRIGR